jgi:hypothetical protein
MSKDHNVYIHRPETLKYEVCFIYCEIDVSRLVLLKPVISKSKIDNLSRDYFFSKFVYVGCIQDMRGIVVYRVMKRHLR